MKKTIVIIAALAVTAVIAFAGCKKEEAKPAMQSAVTSTITSTVTTTAPAAAPAVHNKTGC